LRKTFGTILILISVAGLAVGQVCVFGQVCGAVPEIDGGSAASAIGLLSGALLLIRRRVKK
jgi:uncharacterized protein (TIGR03382 family)